MTRRDRIGLTMLATVAGVLLCLHGPWRPGQAVPIAGIGDAGAGAIAGVEAAPPEASPFDDPSVLPDVRIGPGRPRPAEGPPALPKVDLGGGLAVTVQRVTVAPSFGDDHTHGFFRRPRRATTGPATVRPDFTAFGQRVTLDVRVEDPTPAAEQDHATRIAGRRAQGRGLAFLSGDSAKWGMATVTVDPSVRRVPIEIAVPAGPFLEVERIAPGDAAARRNPNAPEAVPWVIEGLARSRGGREGRLVVRISEGDEADPDAFAGQTWLLQAVCKDGRVVTASGYRSMGDFGTDATINVGYDEVDYVVYRYRPYAWRAVGEVELPTAEMTVTTPEYPEGLKTSSMEEVGRLYRAHRASAATMPSTRPGDAKYGGFGVKSRGVSMNQSVRLP